MSYSLGVDLGTTFVAVAISRPAHVEMFTLGDRSVVAPAVVYAGDDGGLVTGDAASRRAVSNPERLAGELKRRLGDGTPVMLGDAPYDVADLLGALLGDVVRKVIECEGEPPEKVMLSHPATWGPFRRGLFEKLPQLVGLPYAVAVTDSEATARHYAASRRLRDGEILAIYDLGGGTFEASVARTRPNGVEILGTPEGIERLGGIDFDETIMKFVNYNAGGALAELDIRDPRHAATLARLRQECLLAKETLSMDTETILPVSLPNQNLHVRIARSDFEEMIRAQVEATVRALSRTLSSAQVAPDDLSAVLLVGGSSRIPLVARMVSEFVGRPVVPDAHPKFTVALGAAELACLPANAARRRHAAAHSVRTATSELAPASGPVPVLPPEQPRESAPTSDTRRPSAQRDIPDPNGLLTIGLSGNGTPGAHRPTVGPELAADPPPPVASFPAVAPTRAGRTPSEVLNALGWRTPAIMAIQLALAVLFAFGLFLLAGRYWLVPDPESDAVSRLHTEVVAPPVQPEVVPSVPIPSLAGSIPVGATPGYAAVSPNGRLVYVANRDAKTVTVVDTSVNKVTAVIPVDAGPPQFLTFAPDGRRVYLSIFNQQRTIAAVGVLDTTTNKVVTTIPVKTRPFVSATTLDGRLLYVPNHDSGTLSVIDTASLEVVKDIKVAPNPHWIEFSRDGSRAYTANHESGLVTVLDTSTDTPIAQVRVGLSPHSVAVHPKRPLVANANYDSDSVSITNTLTNTVVATVPVGKNPQDVTWAPDGRFLYVCNVTDNTVSVIDAETNKVTATIPTGNSPTSVAVLPNGRQAYVTNLDSGTMSILNVGG